MNNPQAFPMIRDMTYKQDWDYEGGMTLRDYFAGQALMYMNEDMERGSIYIAENAYFIADAMLKERSRDNE